MTNVNKFLSSWLKDLDNFSFPEYEKFPDIDLYMDQVVTYLEKQLQVLSTSSLDKQITPSMINNYVKGEIITAPISKKYNREHISLIEEICILKQVLSIAEIKQIIEGRYSVKLHGDVFNSFKDLYASKKSEAIEYTNSKLENIKTDDIEALTTLSLELALESQVYNTIAKRILFLTKLYNETMAKNDEEKSKDKEETSKTKVSK